VTRPAAGELEVSIFGRGFGEAILCHLGDDRWLAIDSFRAEDGRPVAQSHLARLGVDVTRIRRVVATHWDDDHSKGLGELVRTAKPEVVWMSQVLNRTEVFEFATEHQRRAHPSVDSTGVDEFLGVLRATSTDQIKWAVIGLPLWDDGGVRVDALAPTHATVSDGFAALGVVPPEAEGVDVVRGVDPNMCSVVLLISTGVHRMLLGADLECGRAGRGWIGVVASEEIVRLGLRDAPAQVIKVPHHGSPDAQLDAVWDELLVEPQSVTTRFSPSRRPRQADRDRLRSRSVAGYLVGRPGPAELADSDPMDRRVLEATEGGLWGLDGDVGHVRMRCPIGASSASWSVTTSGQVEPI
jgi:hypothetical protein